MEPSETDADASSTKAASDVDVTYSPPLTINTLLACLVASLGCMTAGCVLAYTSPAVPDINSHTNPFHLNEDEQSWVGSIFNFGSILGAILSGYGMDVLGRKLAIMVAVLPTVVGWTVISASSSVAVLYVGRIMTGLGKGLLVGITHVYIAEIAPSNMRGMLIAGASVANVLGDLYEYCFGYMLHWDWLAIVSAFIPVTLMCLMYYMPESPRFLVLRGKIEEAEEVLHYLRENYEYVPQEMEEIKRGTSEQTKIHLMDFLQPALLKPLLITLGVFTAQQFSGTNIIRIYTVSLFDQTGTTMDSNIQTIVLGLVGVAGTLLSLVTIDRLGRKLSLILSSISMAIWLSAAGAYFKILEVNEEYALNNLSWLPLISLVFNNFSYSIAYDPIPWVIASELFPTRARGIANAIVGFWQGICSFVVSKYFVNITCIIGNYSTFWICAALSIISAVGICIFLPETKGMSLEEIELSFQKQK